MGSATSVPTCPKNFDQHDFSAIQKLYDVLDDDGDFEVNCKEVAQIAEIHVANKILVKQQQLKSNETRKTLTTEDATRRLNNEVSAIKSACLTKINELRQRRESDLKQNVRSIDNKSNELRAEIKRLEIASPPEKQAMFVSAVSVDDRISFKEFFKYMRKRTQNLRELYPEHYKASTTN
jgi:hypothetical protein